MGKIREKIWATSVLHQIHQGLLVVHLYQNTHHAWKCKAFGPGFWLGQLVCLALLVDVEKITKKSDAADCRPPHQVDNGPDLPVSAPSQKKNFRQFSIVGIKLLLPVDT
jgi:hypothetical protein